MIEVYDDDELRDKVKQCAGKLCVITFNSVGCGACKQTTKLLEGLSEQMPDVTFIKVDVKKADEFVQKYKISGVPAFMFLIDGVIAECFQGGNTDYLRKTIERLYSQC
ncbi:thioredoxin-2 [Pelobates cultripes]|uniref:Thioredoxin-2 n=1 Tax=Pelobates cultripes TaxID=61616 RepID=A0AAD1R553_PELCU|nr:thioredoxin-2 [Pelobates cultripes]